jgi:hypothetical protein
VNNWDLDASAPAIVVVFLARRDCGPLTHLAGSDTLRLAVFVIEDKKDLIHKAAEAASRGNCRRLQAALLAGQARNLPIL